MKKLQILLILILFILFFLYEYRENKSLNVIQIVSPTEIAVDINKDNKANSNEFINVNLISFSTKQINEQVLKSLNLSREDYISMGYLAQNFAEKTLKNKKVHLKDNKIYVKDESYDDLLYKNGYALKPNEHTTKQFSDRLNEAKNLKLVILNHRNHKYHKLNCKFAQITLNSEVLPIDKLPQNAKQCNYCYKNISQKEVICEKPTILRQNVKFEYLSNNVKIFITDFIKMKPDKSCSTSACKALLNEINSAENTIDFAIYGYTKVPQLESALKKAENRGVKIRFVFDTQNNGNIYPDTFYLSKIFTSNKHDVVPQIMHNKFFVFDNKTVFTGSANISNTDMSGFNSNVSVIISSAQIANYYTKEFEQMFTGNFHNMKSSFKKDTVRFDNTNISCYFSPYDKIIKNSLLSKVNSAKSYIYIPTFILTHHSLTEALINAKKRGVDVKIILDATNAHKNTHSKIFELRKAGIPVKTEIFAGKLHSKSMIIDDKYAVIGSMNFTGSGEDYNDENVLILENTEIAKFYRKYFEYLWQKIPEKWLRFTARAEAPESIGSCSDGIDNDFDGKIDMQDEGCFPNK